MYNNSKKKVVKKDDKKKQVKQAESKNKDISPSIMKRLKEHSKQHKGGMSSKHIKNMMRYLKQGDSFSKAHLKAVELDKK